MIFKNRSKPRHSLPNRLFHWSYAPAVLACIFSGFYISNPSRKLGFKDMRSALKTHLVAQQIFLASFLGRLCYGYKSKNYKDFRIQRKDRISLPKYLKYQLFLTPNKPQYKKYNPIQKILFTGLGVLLTAQIATGLPLYASDRWMKTRKIFGGLNPIRKLHYLSALLITSMVSGHIYFALTDNLRKLRSIFTGNK